MNAQGTEIEVDTWQIVPDGSRLTDRNWYARSKPGKGDEWQVAENSLDRSAHRVPDLNRTRSHELLQCPSDELNFGFCVSEASTPQGAYVSFGPDTE